MKKILVTGATGFIGLHCLHALSTCNFEVHAISRSTPHVEQKGITWYQADILNVGEISTLISTIQPTHLLHLAWYLEPGQWAKSGFSQNLGWVQSSLELLRSFQENGGERVVMAGSCTEYDWEYGYCTEYVTPTKPNTFYGLCKKSVQQLGEAFSQETDLSWAWGRIFFVYGPHEQPTRLVPSVIQSLLKGQMTSCTHGQQIRDYLFVRDVANAFVSLLECEVKGVVNIASGNPITLKDIVQLIGEKLNQEHLIQMGALPAPSHETPLVVGRNERLVREVKWTPQVNLDHGIDLSIQWWKSQLKKVGAQH